MEDGRESAQLHGFKCDECGHISTTYEIACQSCHSTNISKTGLSGDGEVISFTILNVPSEAFSQHSPYAYVVVRLKEGCGISGWMPDVKSPGDISVGERVRYHGKMGDADVFVSASS